MKAIVAITKKELLSAFNSPLAYLFMIVFLLLTSWLFFQDYFLLGQADMRAFFELVPWMLLFLIPAITMRSFAEEKKLGTEELLLTMPLREYEIVLGKFFSALSFFLLTLLMSFMIPVLVLWTGPADLGVIVASYLGSFFLGASYIALGIYLSSYTDNQIIAFILTLVISFVFLIIGQLFVIQTLPSFLAPVFQFLGLASHFTSISRGVIDSRDILYYLSFIGFFLFLNTFSLTKRSS